MVRRERNILRANADGKSALGAALSELILHEYSRSRSPRWTIAEDRKAYSDEDFALVLRKAAELARSSEARADASEGLTLEEMKSAAAEAGFDPLLVERAARLVAGSSSSSILARLIGGPVRHGQEASYPQVLDEAGADRLLSAVRSATIGAVTSRPGTGESGPGGMFWRSGADASETVVTAHSETDGTHVSASIDRRTGLLITSIATAGGLFAAFLAALAAAEETAISPYLVLGSGAAGTLAVARAYWASSTRRIRRQLASLMHTIDRTIRGDGRQRKPPDEPPRKANLADKLASISEHWSPRLAARVNDTDVKLVKLLGEFVWHRHDDEDELFLVLGGRLLMQFRDREEWVEEGELILVPRGVEHRPVAPEEVHVLLVEPMGTLNTGNVRGDRTVEIVEPI